MVVNERQDFRGSILMWGIILIEAPTLILLSTLYFTGNLGEDGWIALLAVVGIMGTVFLLIMSIQLELKVDKKGLYYRNPPFFQGWKTIPKEDIVRAEIKKSGGLFEFGGVGVRVSRQHTAYIFFSDHLLVVTLRNKKRKLIFSTHRHHDIQQLIDTWNKEQEE